MSTGSPELSAVLSLPDGDGASSRRGSARKSPQVSEVLALQYLHGLFSGDFVPALGQYLGSRADLSGR